jgi:phosphoglycerol transferase MdoB-like AlkP superfamily enzyme
MEYFEEKEVKYNEMTGILKDKNVIFVLMESMDDWIISEKYTPTIKYMMDNGINFNNHYMPNVGMGYTFNAEFAANTGYYCPTTESSASIYTKNLFYVCTKIVKEFVSNYYNQGVKSFESCF